jgi:hypothetical protein
VTRVRAACGAPFVASLCLVQCPDLSPTLWFSCISGFGELPGGALHASTPDGDSRVLVMVVEVLLNRVGQSLHVVKRPPPDPLARQFAEPPVHKVQLRV